MGKYKVPLTTLGILMLRCNEDKLRKAICKELRTIQKICMYDISCEECPFYSRENYALLRSTLFPEEDE